MLYGRDVERARLAGLLEDTRDGRAGALVVRGEAGIGKSAVVEDVIAGAPGLRVLRTQGLESESPLAFASLHRLLRPVLGLLDRLPAPQARALKVAFGAEDGPAVEPFLVAVATLSILTEAAEEAEETAVCCLVDDAHWLDAASADALLFAARRLEADRVAMVFVARDDGTFAAEGVPSLELAGLDPTAARAVLAAQAGQELTDEVSDRILAQSAGNPLALVEIPATLTPSQLDGTAPMPARLPMTARMERVFLDRCRRLPADVQILLLVAAADDSGRTGTVRRAAALLGAGTDALAAAERAGLLRIDGDRVRVRHPLVRSAIYQAATGLDRRTAHRVLADVLGAGGDGDREAWHRAAGADGPDDHVAAALEQVAARAERRGGHAAAAAAYERAAELRTTDQLRAPALFAAARNAWAAGRASQARETAATARERTEDRLLRADIDRLRGRIEVNVGSATDAHRIFTRAAADVAAIDPDRALEMAVAASVLAVYGADSGARPDIPVAADDPRARCLGALLTSMTEAARGDLPGAVKSLQSALDAGARVSDPDVLANLGNAALHLGDDDAHLRTFTALLSAARTDDAGMLVAYVLPRLAFTQLLTGQWTAAGSSAAEALALGVSTGQRALTAAPLAWSALLAALQGKPDLDTLLVEVDTLAADQPLGILADPVHDLVRWARGSHAANGGDVQGALHHLSRLRLPVIARMAAVDRIAAAVRAGDRERATGWVGDIAAFADATGRPWALAAADHGRALLAGTREAPALYERALEHHARGGRPYDNARTHLAYGEFLRRTQHRVEARTHLRLALDTFQDLHAEPLVAHTAQELRASGQTARTREPSSLLTLTPTELRIAQLVSQGLSNKDVAAQCWISPRTVAFHLRNCFAKTGVTSRGELAQLDLT